jgi:DNA transposition AAA+ family ATPase
MDIREKTRAYLQGQELSQMEMEKRIGIPAAVLERYLDPHNSDPAHRVTAALIGYFRRLEIVERQKEKQFLRLQTSAIVMERCEQARKDRDLVMLCGPAGISKTFSLREYVRRRAEQNDYKMLLVTANAVTTPRALMLSMCRLLGIARRKDTHTLVEEIIDKLNEYAHLILVDEANHLNVAGLELLRHIHDMTECGMVLLEAIAQPVSRCCKGTVSTVPNTRLVDCGFSR